jgi:hypothetical protein
LYPVHAQTRKILTLAAPAFIGKSKRIRPPCKPVPGRSALSECDQAGFGFSVEKSGANWFPMCILATIPRKRFFGYSRRLDISKVGDVASTIQPGAVSGRRHGIAIGACVI